MLRRHVVCGALMPTNTTLAASKIAMHIGQLAPRLALVCVARTASLPVTMPRHRTVTLASRQSSAKTDEQEEVAMRLQNKVAIITGADSGIGKAIALQMAREGAAVTIDYIGPPDNATQVVRQIEDAGGKTIAVKADVTDVDQITNLVAQTVQTFGCLDIMVNNAGIEQKHPFLETPLEVWNKIIA